jgi:hypothetical protein
VNASSEASGIPERAVEAGVRAQQTFDLARRRRTVRTPDEPAQQRASERELRVEVLEDAQPAALRDTRDHRECGREGQRQKPVDRNTRRAVAFFEQFRTEQRKHDVAPESLVSREIGAPQREGTLELAIHGARDLDGRAAVCIESGTTFGRAIVEGASDERREFPLARERMQQRFIRSGW